MCRDFCGHFAVFTAFRENRQVDLSRILKGYGVVVNN